MRSSTDSAANSAARLRPSFEYSLLPAEAIGKEMWTLNRPTHTARETYALCITRIRDLALRNKLQSIVQTIEDASTVFDAAAASQLLHTYPREAPVGGIVDRKSVVL